MIKKLFSLLKQNIAFRILFLVELAVILLAALNCLRGSVSYVFYPGENLYSDSEYVQYMTVDDEPVYYAYLEENIAEATVAYTDYFRLYPGSYRVRLHYTAQVNYEEGASFNNGNGYLYLESVENGAFFHFDKVFLRNSLDEVEQTVQITAPWYLNDLSLRVTFYGLGSMTIESIEVTEITAYRYLCLLGSVLLSVLLNVIVYRLFIDRNFRREKELGVLALICAAAVLPFAADWVYFGHDTGFHSYRILLLANELQNGNYFPAIYSAALNGYGYAAPLFYGQIFLYVPAILYNCGFSLTFVYNFYICMMSVATCLIMYYCANRIFKKSGTALLASALYTLSAVRLTNIMTRAAFGEFTAQAFLPLIILGFYQIYTAPKGDKITIRRYWPVVAGLTGVLQSHILTSYMSVLLIAFFCILFFRKTVEKTRFLALCRAAGLTVLVNLAFLVPTVTSMGMDLYVDHAVNYIQTGGTYLVQLFNSIVNNYQVINAADTASNEFSLSIGFSVTLGLILYLVYLYRIRRNGCEDPDRKYFSSVCFGFCLLTLFLSTVYMFYDALDFLPDWVYSVLTVYQFPWRWLSFATVFGVFCTAAVADSVELRSLFGGLSVSALLCAVLLVNTGQIWSDQLTTSGLENLSNHLYYFNSQIGDTGEYLLYPTDSSALAYRELFYDESALSVSDYRYEENSFRLYVENLTQETVTVDIPVFHYDNYIAYDTDTKEGITIATGENNRIQLEIPAGYIGTVEVKYQLPLLWKLAIAVSAVTDLVLIWYCVPKKRKGSFSMADQ